MRKRYLNTLFIISIITVLTSCNRVMRKEYEDGGLTYKIEYVGDSNSGYEGDVKTYYHTGGLCSKYHIVHNLKEGYYEFYSKNGKLEEEDYYIHGKRNGPCEKFFESGVLRIYRVYKDDTLNGPSVYYFPNGKLSSYDFIVKGVPIYICHFDSNGVMKENDWDYYINYSSRIKVGEKLKAKFKVPYMKGINDVGDFNIAIYVEDIKDSNVEIYCTDYKKKSWIYTLMEKGMEKRSLIDINNIPINDLGEALFEYTPEVSGSYIFKGVVVYARNKHLGESFIGPLEMRERQINLVFKVLDK